jgi:hypothetical protein
MWGVCLEQMFKQGHLSDVNDSYYLMKQSQNNKYASAGYIFSIYNHNSLNFLISDKLVMSVFPLFVLQQHCRTNNISRPIHLYNLFERIENSYPYKISEVLNILFDKKFYDMIKIFSKHELFLEHWIADFIRRNKAWDNINDDIKQEIIVLIDMNIATPEEIYKIVKRTLYVGLRSRLEILSFIKDTYDISL